MTNIEPQDPPIEQTDPVEPPAAPPADPAPQPNEPPAPAEPNGDADPTDPEGWKGRSRLWEERSKANLSRAEAAEAEKATLQADLEAARAELAALQASNTRAEAVRSAAKAANVSEDVLSRMAGDSAEEIAENARILAAAIKPSAPSYPPVSDNGGGGNSYGMTLEQINAIKDPTERVMMRAKYPNAK